ncbi:MAG TPA: hypothetical protein VFS21_11765 [Roseiflexaceae bacterium]|nr:hypothetical protein [Roseiflexaceae bacterium]
MNTNRQQSVSIGTIMIGVGLLWWLNLWWLLVPGILAVGGAIGYVQRRTYGRPVEAVQIGLWGVGLGLLFLLGFVWPGILLLAGLSILLRGREIEADTAIQNALARIANRGRAAPSPVQQVPIVTHQSFQVQQEEKASTGETRRL